MVVYTAIFGSYDAVPQARPECRHVLFTDEAPPDPKGWEVVVVEPQFDNPQRENRYYKLTAPWKHFRGETTLYQDANLTLTRPVSEVADILKEGQDADVYMRRHPRKRTALQEFTAVRGYDLVDPELLDAQLLHYGRMRVPMDAPIPEANLILATPRATGFMGLWWDQVRLYAPRDQLGYAYALHFSKARVHLSSTPLEQYAVRKEHLKPRARGLR